MTDLIPLPPLDFDAAEAMWTDYAAAHPEAVAVGRDHTIETFGDHVALANELLDLVLAGGKRATAELAVEYSAAGDPLPRIGSHWIACDGSGTPRVIIRSTELRLATFDRVDESFAFDEGEGDRTLDSWRDGHRRYWERTSAARGAAFSPETDEIVLERFSVVWPPEFAD